MGVRDVAIANLLYCAPQILPRRTCQLHSSARLTRGQPESTPQPRLGGPRAGQGLRVSCCVKGVGRNNRRRRDGVRQLLQPGQPGRSRIRPHLREAFVRLGSAQ